jgi:quercetin dioxygenase-like cupin family protein
MVTRRVWLGGTGALLAQALTSSAQTRGGPKQGGPRIVFEHALPDLTLKGWNATAVEVTYAPGESSAAHRHPGITIAYVLEGEIRSKVGDEPERTYTVGQMFLETPNQLHGVSGNASVTKPAKLLAILLAENGQPLTTQA